METCKDKKKGIWKTKQDRKPKTEIVIENNF